ncbi:MAG: hypothetical protein Q8K24_05840 [Hydrogenophaga sp.]|nr:hypothetical protein [Hydrogenophaga sp.]
MKKADYLILARELRRRISVWSPADHTAGVPHDDVQARMSESMQAASLARYLAEHLSVDKIAFLQACGLKP